MKTTYKQSVYVFIFLLFILANSICAYAQNDANTGIVTISGVIKDERSKRKLEYVNISIPNSNIGTVTNSDGFFSIKIPKSSLHKIVIFSHIGYKQSQILVEKENKNELTIFLTPQPKALDEVIIRVQNPIEIVKEALSKIPENYSKKHSMLTGFYRETTKKGRNYINITEAIVDMYKTPYSQDINKDRVQIYKGRQLLSQKRGDTLIVKLQGGPNLSLSLDIVKNQEVFLDSENLEYYSYKMEEPVMIDNRSQYVISFQPRVVLPYPLYYGKLYIDREKKAFTKAEFNMDMANTEKSTQAILRKKPLGLRFKPSEVSYLVNYNQKEDITYLSYIRNEIRFRCDWRRRLFHTNYEIVSEMVVTDIKEENVTNIPYKVSFKSGHSLSDKVSSFFDDSFWGNYNIIEPTESLESAVKKLRKQSK
jgi:hypothetical protein